MASKNSKKTALNTKKNKPTMPKSKDKSDELKNIIASLKKDLKEQIAVNKNLVKSYNILNIENKKLQTITKNANTQNASLSKQSGNIIKKHKDIESKNIRLQEELNHAKEQISILKK